MRKALLTLAGLALAAAPAAAAEKTITMNAISASGIGPSIGTITARDTAQGLMLIPQLSGLSPPGPHGFHVHEKPDCGPGPGANGQPAPGMAAGGHYDPHKTGRHHGPHRDAAGHKGDLPPLVVNADGSATLPVLAPRLKVRDLSGRALMIHAGGDNYADEPQPLGGGGGRIACGVVR
ncbi:MAG TPA: superoxide dismutase [Cu-Zn] SodC [Ferrovibrio sp.]|uniref:superoxide dismutase [Cu-Zn] SodC n=1 Tax=Ferrovibrio sp. TaxID=1917215 RepID=UPI002B4B95E0|nr:superoxide dismutase [Cu-Zn] SodC [Ferrovibrio sp.]HLT76318.1 superoxide dismutase [Cu-Zn] SodC [Ferrovibrio sp.]